MRRHAHGATDICRSVVRAVSQVHAPERFLDEMNRVVPWADLVAAIESVYPKTEGSGRPPVGVEGMLRLHCLQQWFNLSDPVVEEALYDSRAMRHFVGIDRAANPCLMRRPSVSFGICWRLPSWENSSLHGSGPTWPHRG